MAGELIGALRVALGFDTAEFTAGTKKARAEAKAAAKDIQGSFTSLGDTIRGLAAGAVATAVIGAAKRALDYASSLDEVAQQLGVTSASLQVYRYAASQVGVSQDEMDTGLRKLTKTMGDAVAGAKAPVELFKSLGVSLRDANGDILTADQILPRLADALAQIKDPATRARIETELLGKAGQKLDTLLSGGSGAIDDLTAAARDLGIVLSEKQIQDADATADKLSELKQVLEANIAGFVSDNAKAIYDFANSIENLVVHLKDGIDWLYRFNDAAQKRILGDNQGKQLAPTLVGRLQSWAEKVVASQFAGADVAGERDQIAGGSGGALGSLVRNALKPSSGGYEKVKDNGGGAKKAAADAKRAAEQAVRQEDKFRSDQARIDDEFLGLKEQLTADVRLQAMYQHEAVDRAEDAKYRDDLLAEQEKQLPAGAAEKLRLQRAQNVDLQHAAVNRDLDAKLSQQDLDSTLAALDLKRDQLDTQESLATTAGQRRDLELRLLKIAEDEERARLTAAIAARDLAKAPADDPERRDARNRLNALSGIYADRAAAVRQSTQGPGEAYLRTLNKTSAEIAEGLEESGVSALERFNASLDDSVKKSLHLHGIFGDIVGDLIDMAIKQTLIKPLAASLFGDGSGGGGLFSGIAKLLGGASSLGVSSAISGSTSLANSIHIDTSGLGGLPRLATGGTIGGLGGIDRNLLSINGVPSAMVGRGEMLKVEPNNDNGRGGAMHFDLRGAVMTQDLLDQMNAIGQASQLGAVGQTETRAIRRARSRLA